MDGTTDITIRFVSKRMVAVFDDKENLDRWLKFYGDGFVEPHMYTIHGLEGVQSLDKYMESMV